MKTDAARRLGRPRAEGNEHAWRDGRAARLGPYGPRHLTRAGLQQQPGAVFERTTRWRGGIGNAVNTIFDQMMERFPEPQRANVYQTAPTFVPPPIVAAADAAPAPAAGRGGDT